jgi:hypothetical protein
MRFTNNRALTLGVVLVLFISLSTFSFTFASQKNILPSDKISQVVRNTIGRLHDDGVTGGNARLMDLQQKYGNPLTRFDSEGRIGLLIDVKAFSDVLMNRLVDLGGNIIITEPDAKLIAVYLPIDNIEAAAASDEIRIIREITGGVLNTGSVTTEGDSIHHAVDIRSDLLIGGDSVNVGVISDGCVTWIQSQATGDLPASFNPGNFTFMAPAGNKIGIGDEGTAMMEIVYDIAPNANLFFYGALHDAAGSAAHVDAIKRLVREKGCRIIVDDLTWYDQPMFEDGTAATVGTIAAAVQWALDTGVVYISSAGNWADGPGTPMNPISRTHYQNLYNDINLISNIKENKPLPNGPIPAGYPPPNWDDLHNFDPTPGQFDPGLAITVPPGKTVTVVLQWTDPALISSDPWGSSKDDYDLYLYDATLTFNLTGMTGAGSQIGFQNPWEKVSLTNYEGTPIIYNIVINHRDTIPKPPPKLLGLYINGCSMVEYFTPHNSIWGQPGVSEAIAVGAIPQNNITVIESFSSLGNYDVYWPSYVSRPKPDVVAVDGVQVTGVGGFGSPFYGTSASAPHIAGMAALLLSWNKLMTPAQVHLKFERTATDLGAVGFDQAYGYGRADIEQAFYEVDTAIGVQGPQTLPQGIGTPQMFFTSPSGYAMGRLSILDPLIMFNTGTCKVTVTSGSPYTDAGVTNLGCPTIKRWFDYSQTGSANGQYTAYVTAYLDESERVAAGIDTSNFQIIHWNGFYYQTFAQNNPVKHIGNTWIVNASYPNASLSPFFVGYLTHGLDVSTVSNDSGGSNSEATVTFKILNTGNGWDTVSCHIFDNKGWTLSSSDTSISLTSSQELEIPIDVTIPSEATAPMIDTLWFVASSISESSIMDSSFAIIKALNRGLTVSTVANDSASPNMVATVTFNVMNTGEIWDTIACHITDNYGWSLAPNDTAFSLSSTQELNVSIDVSIHEDANSLMIDTIWLVASSVTTPVINDSSFAIVTVLNNKIVISVRDGWNMISLPLIPDSNWKTALFPTAVSNAFTYIGSYQLKDTLQAGVGYWLKFTGAQEIDLRGQSLVSDTINVVTGWNMIGTISSSLPIDSIVSSPNGMIISSFFMYNGTYYETDTLQPGDAYWVKVDTFGTLLLGNTKGVVPTNHVRIVRINEMPPPPPDKELRCEQMTIPTTLILDQNYPNPFNPMTTIEYTLPGKAFVTLKIFNMLGQEVATLLESSQDAGFKSVSFNAGDLPSGLYTYRLIAGKLICTKKMILLR